MAPRLSLVVPCYNEEEALPETTAQLIRLLDGMIEKGLVSPSSDLLYVDDGSRDTTWSLISNFHLLNPRVKGLKLARNAGHQNALLAGLMEVECEISVSLDADLQDDISVIPNMVSAYAGGAEIVLGVRSSRTSDTWFKRSSAQKYYAFLKSLGIEIHKDHADFRLMSRAALEALRQFEEVNLFLRGLVPLLGFKTAIVTYERKARMLGESKYPFRKMMALAIDGITSMSAEPLRWITRLGFGIAGISLGLGCWALSVRLLTNEALPGWASVVIPIYFLGAIQMISLGIIGIYVAKTYAESKRRPRYLIERRLQEDRQARGRPVIAEDSTLSR